METQTAFRNPAQGLRRMLLVLCFLMPIPVGMLISLWSAISPRPGVGGLTARSAAKATLLGVAAWLLLTVLFTMLLSSFLSG